MQPFRESPAAVRFSGTNGIFEDNVFVPGYCTDGRAFEEEGAASYPRLFANNYLGAEAWPGFLYEDGTVGGLTTPAAVDALTDTMASGTTADICQ
jgi:hypothetical protein